jgi:mono/diheme cytochrome c family protein
VDRWAIAAYIRALQLSQNATRQDVPAGESVHPMSELLERANLGMNFLGSWDDSVDAATDTSSMPQMPPAALPLPTAIQANPSLSPAPGGAAPTTLGKASPVSSGASVKASEIAALKAAPGTQEKAAPAAPPAPKGDAAHGKVLYAANCSACHQPTRAGIPGMIPSLMGIVEKDGEAKVRKTVKEGVADAKPPMPPHPDFTDADMEDLLAYLRTKE